MQMTQTTAEGNAGKTALKAFPKVAEIRCLVHKHIKDSTYLQNIQSQPV